MAGGEQAAEGNGLSFFLKWMLVLTMSRPINQHFMGLFHGIFLLSAMRVTFFELKHRPAKWKQRRFC